MVNKQLVRNCIITNSAVADTFQNTKLYISLETLSTQNNIKLLKIQGSVLKQTINWNKYQSKVSMQAE